MSVLSLPVVVFESLYPPQTHSIGYPYPYTLHLVSDGLTGTKNDTQPIADEAKNAWQGFFYAGVNGQFLYDRIIVDPSVLQLGNLVSAQVRQVSVWNGFFTSKTVSDFVENEAEGITVVEPDSVPYVLAPFQEVFYEFQVSLDGPASVNASYTITIDGDDYTITITGSRVVLWPFAPNWQSTVNESLEWLTQIYTAHNGSEQRYQLRSKPRRRLEYDLWVRNEEAQRFDNMIWGWQNRAFAVPLWQYKCKLTAEALPGASSLSLNTSSAGFTVGQTAVLLRSPDYYEVVEIDSVTSNSLGLSRPLQLSWSAGDLVYPVMIGNFESNVPVTRLTSDKLTSRVLFLGDPQQTEAFIPVGGATNTYNGKEIIVVQPDWSGGIDNSSTYESALVDSSTGMLSRSTTHDTPMQLKRFRWLLKNRAAVESFRAFLGRLKGRNRAVYIPSWHEDLTLISDIGVSDVSITVRDVQFFNLVGSDPARGHLMIRDRSGNKFFRPMENIGKSGDDLSINIGTSLGQAVSVAQCKSISLVVLYRLASDRVTIQWHTNEVATVEADFITVKA